MGLRDSLNRFTIFTQPPYSFAAFLVTGRLCMFTLSPGVAYSLRLSMVSYTMGTEFNSAPAGLEPSPIQHLPAGSRHGT